MKDPARPTLHRVTTKNKLRRVVRRGDGTCFLAIASLARGVEFDPMHQFQIHPLIPIRIPLGGKLIDISFTNASLL